jgi:hypothetical protein
MLSLQLGVARIPQSLQRSSLQLGILSIATVDGNSCMHYYKIGDYKYLIQNSVTIQRKLIQTHP